MVITAQPEASTGNLSSMAIASELLGRDVFTLKDIPLSVTTAEGGLSVIAFPSREDHELSAIRAAVEMGLRQAR